MKFHKYEALGNDYIVLERDCLPALTADRIRRLCDRHRGIGSDGVLIEGAPTEAGELQLRSRYFHVLFCLFSVRNCLVFFL